jgi:dihydroxyacetone kinase
MIERSYHTADNHHQDSHGGSTMAHVHNEPTDFYREMLDGFLLAYSRYVERVPGASGVMRRGGPVPGKVSVVIGGGSGHYPAFCGVVGPGLAHGAVVGDIFTSPSTEQCYRVGKALDGGAGVLFSFGNYAGDVMNFGSAEQRLRAEGIDCRTVLVTDDVASAKPEEREKRRGVAGDFPVFKIAAAAADRGDSIDEVERLAIKTNDATFSFGAAFAGCTFPGQSEPLFTVEPGTMELGLGIHGEPGVQTVPAMSAKELGSTLVKPLLAERPEGTRRAAVLLNGLGATKYEELFVLYTSIIPLLEQAGVEIILPEVGELVTSLDMAGCSLTVTWLNDELQDLWCAPADTPSFRRGAGAAATAGAGSGAVTTTAVAADAQTDVATPTTPEALGAADTVRRVLQAMRDLTVASAEEWGRIDAIAGDGDHGVGMTRGMEGALAAASSAAGGPSTVLQAAADAFADKAGGSSGALWGSFLRGIALRLPDDGSASAREIVAAMASGTDALQALGKCELEDKTMFDALKPFATDLTARVQAGERLRVAWRAAAELATTKAAATADLMPKLGRARPLGEKSLGTPDPGATSMAALLVAVAPIWEED